MKAADRGAAREGSQRKEVKKKDSVPLLKFDGGINIETSGNDGFSSQINKLANQNNITEEQLMSLITSQEDSGHQ